MTSPTPIRALTLALVAAALAAAAPAHEHPCGHTHELGGLINCTNDDGPCTLDGNGGQCKQVTEFSRAWCECRTSGNNGGGGCVSTSLGTYFFDDQGAGPPAPFSSPIYLATGDGINGATVVVGSGPGIEFDSKVEFLTGNFTVFFPMFDPGDPEVLATLEDVSLLFAPIGASGPNTLALANGTFQPLLYDDATGVLGTVDAAGILLHLDNDLVADLPVRVYFEGHYRPGGELEILFQHVDLPELFADGLEWGDTSLWSTTQP